jgi:hypothetical protein
VDGRRLAMRDNQIVTPFEHCHFEVFNGLENVAEPVFHNTNSVREMQLVQPNGVCAAAPVLP